jgi:hypothetical protein
MNQEGVDFFYRNNEQNPVDFYKPYINDFLKQTAIMLVFFKIMDLGKGML